MLKNERLWQFVDGLSDSTPTPGGGSAAALSGALGAALVSMVARLTFHNEKYAHLRDEMKAIVARSERERKALLATVDRDAKAYNAVILAYRMPRDTDVKKKKRAAAIQKALKQATNVPFEVANRSLAVLELAEQISMKGMKGAISDVGVGAVLADAAVKGAIYNVKINLGGIKDGKYVTRFSTDISEILEVSTALAKEVENNINQTFNE